MTEDQVLKRGRFYNIYDRAEILVLEDKTKRGLETHDLSMDEKYKVEAEHGMIYDMDGIGHLVGIRWYFPKKVYSLSDVVRLAEDLDARYKAIQEVTCPDDD